MAIIYDKKRRPIFEGDVLKVYHFTGARNKRYYMYKQAGPIELLGREKNPYMKIFHLPVSEGSYSQKADGSVLENYEIVQGYPDYEERKKRP